MSHVLIIEDEALVALDLEEILEREGATSFAYADSEELAVRCAMKRRPNFIISDVCLVAGTGPNAIARITDLVGHVPAVFVTGSPNECGAINLRVLSKPIRSRELVAAFHEARQPVPEHFQSNLRQELSDGL